MMNQSCQEGEFSSNFLKQQAPYLRMSDEFLSRLLDESHTDSADSARLSINRAANLLRWVGTRVATHRLHELSSQAFITNKLF